MIKVKCFEDKLTRVNFLYEALVLGFDGVYAYVAPLVPEDEKGKKDSSTDGDIVKVSIDRLKIDL